MKVVNKPQTIIAMGRPCSVSKEFTPQMMMQSPDKQLVYASKSQSQAKIQTYITSPYMQSPTYETKQNAPSPHIAPTSSPRRLSDSYTYKVKPLESRENYKPVEQRSFQNDTFRYEYNKTFAETFKGENKDTNTERKSQTTKKDSNQSTFQESRENIRIGYEYLSRSPLCENNRMAANYGAKSRISSEISKISGTLRELLSGVQRSMNNGQLSDSMNDKMIEVLSTFRKLEEMSYENGGFSQQTSNEYEKRIVTMTEDYNKLKTILEQLQSKMTALVSENQKLNKNLIEQESRVGDEMRKKQIAEEKAQQANKEFNRVFECLQINQRENEELKRQLQERQSEKSGCVRQLFQQDEYKRYQQLQKDYEQLEMKYSQLKNEKKLEYQKSPGIIKSVQQNNKSELEVKLLQLQIENDNLKSEMAHTQVDSKAIDSKNEMIVKLDDKIKQLLKEKQQYEDQQNQINHSLEINIEQLKTCIHQKENEYQQLFKQKQEMEQDLKGSITNYQAICKGQEDKLNLLKGDYQKLLDDYKQLDIKKTKTQEELRQSDKLIDEVQQEVNHLKTENKKLYERNQIISHQLEQSNQQIQQQQQLQISLNTQIDSYKQQEYQLRQDIERVEHTLKVKSQEFRNQLTELNEQLGLTLRKVQDKDKQIGDLIDEMSGMQEQYEVSKKANMESVNELERRIKNIKIQHEETLALKENEINDLKLAMDQQIKMLDKRNALSSFDYEQRESQLSQDLIQKSEQLEIVKSELEKLRSTNYNLQEEILKSGMLLSQHQANMNTLKNELTQSKQEQQQLMDMLRKRKEEAELLHQNLEEARKDQQNKKINVEDSRRSLLKQQDLQITIETLQRENLTVQQKLSTAQNELNRKQRELQDKNEEYLILKRKYEENQNAMERLEKRWAEKIDQHRKQ